MVWATTGSQQLPHRISLANIYFFFCKITINTDKILAMSLIQHRESVSGTTTYLEETTRDEERLELTGSPSLAQRQPVSGNTS